MALAFLTTTFGPATALAQTQTSISVGATSLPAAYYKKRRRKKSKSSGIAPAGAEEKREAIRDSVAGDKEKGDWAAVAQGLEYNAALLGDPVTMLEGADARLELAREKRDVAEAQQAIETATVALDIAYFYQDVAAGDAQSNWLVIDPSEAGSLIEAGESKISEAEALIEEIESEAEEDGDDVAVAAADKPKKKKKKRGKAKPGTVLIGTGAALTAIGVAGAGMGIAGIIISTRRQKEVEALEEMGSPDPDEINRLDQEGQRANVMGYAGLALAVVGVAVGAPLIAVGIKKRKEAGPGASASLQVAPMFGRTQNGLVIQGRF